MVRYTIVEPNPAPCTNIVQTLCETILMTKLLMQPETEFTSFLFFYFPISFTQYHYPIAPSMYVTYSIGLSVYSIIRHKMCSYILHIIMKCFALLNPLTRFVVIISFFGKISRKVLIKCPKLKIIKFIQVYVCGHMCIILLFASYNTNE